MSNKKIMLGARYTLDMGQPVTLNKYSLTSGCEAEVPDASEVSLAQLIANNKDNDIMHKTLLITCSFKDCCNFYI